MAVTIYACPNNVPLGYFQSSGQGRGSIAFIIVRERATAAFLEREPGWRQLKVTGDDYQISGGLG